MNGHIAGSALPPADDGAMVYGPDIGAILSPARRAIGIRRIVHTAALGGAAGALAGAFVLLAVRAANAGPGGATAMVCLIAGIALGAVGGVVQWPALQDAARQVDLHFDLHDRLTTAAELRWSTHPVATRQRLDVAHHIEGLRLSKSSGRWLQWRDAVALVLALSVLAGALALNHPGSTRHSASSISSQSRRDRAAATRVKQLASQLHLGPMPGPGTTPAIRKLQQELARLRSQLLRAPNERAALRAISSTQGRLHTLASGLHPVNSRAVAQLNSSLGQYGGNRRAGAGSKSTTRSAAAAARALSRLARALAHLPAAQRAALARALARAANTSSSTALRASLMKAASSLANGQPAAARSALQRAAQSLTQSASQATALSRIGTAGQQLSALKNNVAGIPGTIPKGTPNGSRVGQGAPGTGRTGRGSRGGTGRAGVAPGTGKRPGSGQGRGSGVGKRSLGLGGGQGRGRGAGPAQGRGAGHGATGRVGVGTGTGRGLTRGHGGGGQGSASRSKGGHSATVFIPGRQGTGARVVQNGPQGAPQPGSIVPYQQVVGQYAASAHQALDRAALPPDLQSNVRRYFSTISH